jgi:hypothetical protein
MLRNILFQLLALISNIVTQPWRQARFLTVWTLFEKHERVSRRPAGRPKISISQACASITEASSNKKGSVGACQISADSACNIGEAVEGTAVGEPGGFTAIM